MDTIAPITTVIPVHNREGTVETALNSIQAQSLRPMSIIAVDDGSTDQSLSMLQAYARKHPNVTILHQENAGPSAARNAGIRNAKTEWITFLDSDDYWYSHHLENLYKIASKHTDLAWVTAAHEIHHLDGSVEKRRVRVSHEISVLESYLSATQQGVPVNTDSIMVRREALLDAGCFREDWRVFEDSFLWFCLGVKHPRLGYSHPVSSCYNHGDISLTSQARHDLDHKMFLGKRFLQATIEYATQQQVLGRTDVRAFLNQIVNTQLKELLLSEPARYRTYRRELSEIYPDTKLYPRTRAYAAMSILFPVNVTRRATRQIRNWLSR